MQTTRKIGFGEGYHLLRTRGTGMGVSLVAAFIWWFRGEEITVGVPETTSVHDL